MKWIKIEELSAIERHGDEAGFLLCAPELVDPDCNVFGVGMGYYHPEDGWQAGKWDMNNDEWREVTCNPTHFARIEPPNAVHEETGQ